MEEKDYEEFELEELELEESNNDISKEKKSGKNKRTNYSISEIQTVLNTYFKVCSIRQTSKIHNVPKSTLFGWIKKKKFYLSIKHNSSYKILGRGRKSDSHDYDEILLDFIKEGRAYDIAITSSEVICKALEIIPGFKEKSYNNLHNWFKRFRERYLFSIGKVSKIPQILSLSFLENIRNYLFTPITDIIDLNNDFNSTLFANVNETPIVLEPYTEISFKNVGEVTVKIRNFGKSNQRISCILCIFSNGYKAPPMLVFKGLPENTLEKRLSKIKVVLEKKIFVVCQENSWVDPNTFIKWLNLIWFKINNIKNIKKKIIYLDRTTSHISNEIKKILNDNNSSYRLIPPGLTPYCQPLDLCINKTFNDAIKFKYREFCNYWKSTKKPTPEDLIQWISEIWWSNIISNNTIKNSFKKAGINLNLDGSEDYLFHWPKTPDMVLVEDLRNLNKKKEFIIDLDFDESTERDDSKKEEISFDSDILSLFNNF